MAKPRYVGCPTLTLLSIGIHGGVAGDLTQRSIWMNIVWSAAEFIEKMKMGTKQKGRSR